MATVKERKIYIDILKIIAALGVIYDHSSMFLNFGYEMNTAEFIFSNFFSCVFRPVIPYFFMCSGALLLGREEDIRTVLKNRIFKTVLVLTAFSFLYYLKTVIKLGQPFNLFAFFAKLPTEPIFTPYWFLYSYLAFLIMLPLLRLITLNMTESVYRYLLALAFLFGVLFPYLGQATGYYLYGDLQNPALFVQINIVCPLLGYGMSHYRILPSNSRVTFGLFAALILTVTFTMYLGWRDGAPSVTDVQVGLIAISSLLFLILRNLTELTKPSPRFQKIAAEISGCCLGIYFLEGFLGPNGRLDIIMNTLSPYIGVLAGFLVELLVIFLARLVLVKLFFLLCHLLKVGRRMFA